MPLPWSAAFSGSNYLAATAYTGSPAAFSVSCWVYLTTSQTSKCFVSAYVGGSGWVVGIHDSTPNKIKFYLGSNTLYQSGTLTPGAWTLALFTWDGTTAKIYLNGSTTADNSLVSGVSFGSPSSDYIGWGGPSINQATIGNLAGVGYWTRALSGSEGTTLYGGGRGLAAAELSGSLLTSLVSYHDFADPGNLGADGSGNGHTYSPTGSPARCPGPGFPDLTPAPARGKPPGAVAPHPRWRDRLLCGHVLAEGSGPAARDLAGRYPGTLGAGMAWSRGGWGPQLQAADAGGSGSYLNLGTMPGLSGATELTIAVLAALDTATAGGAGNRFLFGAESGGTAECRLGCYQTPFQTFWQIAGDFVYPNVSVPATPAMGRPFLLTARLAPGGVRSLWWGPYKVAERTDAGLVYPTDGYSKGVGGSVANPTRCWSGPIVCDYIWTRALADREIAALAADPLAPARPATNRAAALAATIPPGRAAAYHFRRRRIG